MVWTQGDRVKFSTVQRLASFVVALGLVVSMPPSYAQLFNSPVDQFSATDRAELRSGKVLVTGDKGNYVSRVLVSASVDRVWAVLTDYPAFSKFLPHVTSSRVVETRGAQKIIEQVDQRRVLVVDVRSRVLSTVTETQKQRIDFRRIEGDVPKLEGYWTIEPVAPYAGASPDQVLITQVVAVTPVENVPTGLFYSFFKNSLRDNFVAIRKEVDRHQ